MGITTFGDFEGLNQTAMRLYVDTKESDIDIMGLSESDPTRVDIVNKEGLIGEMEVSLIVINNELLLEIRNIEIFPEYRRRGHLSAVIDTLLKQGNSIYGEIADYSLETIWTRVGADFITSETFTIRRQEDR